ncbi:MAG: hypothetical protein ACI9CF_000999 [Candidatus Omnitrophota bacterium]|jgi:hypothetical protein
MNNKKNRIIPVFILSAVACLAMVLVIDVYALDVLPTATESDGRQMTKVDKHARPSIKANRPNVERWVPVAEEVWVVYVDAPSYNLAEASELYGKKQYEAAASRVGRSERLIQQQIDERMHVLRKLAALSSEIKGEIVSEEDFLSSINEMERVLNKRNHMVPVIAGYGVIYADEVTKRISKGREHFLKNEFQRSSIEIKKASAFVNMAAAKAAGGGRKFLSEAASSLDKLAKDVQAGTVEVVKEFDVISGTVHEALAKRNTV